jgi:hypothetical protein
VTKDKLSPTWGDKLGEIEKREFVYDEVIHEFILL